MKIPENFIKKSGYAIKTPKGYVVCNPIDTWFKGGDITTMSVYEAEVFYSQADAYIFLGKAKPLRNMSRLDETAIVRVTFCVESMELVG